MPDKIKGGVLVIDKPSDITSHDVVNKIRKLYSTRQVGHTGTLDPMATGVIVILVGGATKASEYVLAADKGYEATLRLGIKTDTGDITGKVISVSDNIPGEEEMVKATASLTGDIMQTPPMYSALKRDGKKLVDLAREGIVVDREPRKITIFSAESKKIDEKNYSLSVRCSKGTYIRTLCEDIAEKAGTLAAMTSLRRTSSGDFTAKDAHTLEEVEKMSPDERLSLLIPVESLFQDCPKVTLDKFYSRLAHNGAEIYQKKIGTDYGKDSFIRIYDEGGFFALGKVGEYEEGSAIKPVKQFI